MSRIVRFHQTGGPDVLKLEDESVSAPGAGEVQIAVKAIGLNRAEAMFRSGAYLESPVLPARIGYEAAGVVTAVGPQVPHFQVGDRVSTIPAFSMNQYGSYGELVNMPAGAVAHAPESLSFEESAAIWMQYLTAYGALISIAAIQPGDAVLVPAASSSVGLAAIQIANQAGAVPVALTRTSAKAELLRQQGARHVIATEEQDVVAEVQRITQGAGARVAFDPVGGPTVELLAEALSPGGILFLYGALSTQPTPLPLFSVLAKTLTIRGYLLFEFTQDAEKLERGKEFVRQGLEAGHLKPLISRTFPLSEIVAAHRYLESNQQIGKIVVTVD